MQGSAVFSRQSARSAQSAQSADARSFRHQDTSQTVQSGATLGESLSVQPRRSAATLPATLETTQSTRSDSKQRRRVKLYAPGDLVDLYVDRYKRWMTDAEVIERLQETTTRDGMKIRAGSMKVVYAEGARHLWVAPQQAPELLRPSKRPRLPVRMAGLLNRKDPNAWLLSWSSVYVDVAKGVLRWWDSPELAESGQKETRALNLRDWKLDVQDSAFRLQATGADEEECQFSADGAEVASWSAALTANMAYAVALTQLRRQASDSDMKPRLSRLSRHSRGDTSAPPNLASNSIRSVPISKHGSIPMTPGGTSLTPKQCAHE